ncbi:Protein of unknown function [Bacillus mobilis]|nr:Protein of unknown function [Bacillus mobilis]
MQLAVSGVVKLNAIAVVAANVMYIHVCVEVNATCICVNAVIPAVNRTDIVYHNIFINFLVLQCVIYVSGDKAASSINTCYLYYFVNVQPKTSLRLPLWDLSSYKSTKYFM